MDDYFVRTDKYGNDIYVIKGQIKENGAVQGIAIGYLHETASNYIKINENVIIGSTLFRKTTIEEKIKYKLLYG